MKKNGQIQVLVADDSMFMRHLLRKALEADPRIRMLGEARDGLEAVEKNEELIPDVVVMDVEMPRMDGIAALSYMMKHRPVPVVMFSSLTTQGALVTLEALSQGAVDFLAKPESRISISSVADELRRKVIAAAGAHLQKRVRSVPATSRTHPRRSESRRVPAKSLVVIGSSTGGPQALDSVIPVLPSDFSGCVLVCQHMPPGFTGSMAQRLDAMSVLPVREAAEGDVLAAGEVLIAPGGLHSKVVRHGEDVRCPASVHLDSSEPVHGVRPSADVTLHSAAPVYGPNLMVVILTGMGFDGAKGAKEAKELGATVVCQDEETSVVWGMPRACIEIGACDKVLPLPDIAGAAAEFVATVEARS